MGKKWQSEQSNWAEGQKRGKFQLHLNAATRKSAEKGRNCESRRMFLDKGVEKKRTKDSTRHGKTSKMARSDGEKGNIVESRIVRGSVQKITVKKKDQECDFRPQLTCRN